MAYSRVTLCQNQDHLEPPPVLLSLRLKDVYHPLLHHPSALPAAFSAPHLSTSRQAPYAAPPPPLPRHAHSPLASPPHQLHVIFHLSSRPLPSTVQSSPSAGQLPPCSP